MTPSAWIDVIYRGVVLLAIVFIGWWIYHAGGQAHDIQDFKAVQQQIKDVAKTLDDWQKADTEAKEKRDATIKALSDRIDKQPPIIVRVAAPKTSAGAVPGIQAGGSNSGPTQAGGCSERSGEDRTENLRPAFNAAEHKYSEALAECWRIIATCKVPK